ncbi:MAG: glucokinase [Candidatus Eisenbacteria bacterium]|nr:glucokinase [Candidatus Eisenbacteria bacterium]
MRVLVGDVGGTKTLLATAEIGGGRPRFLREERYATADWEGLLPMTRAFLGGEEARPEAACFGVAGPVAEGRCIGPNLPWPVDGGELSRGLGVDRLRIINDFDAAGYGIPLLVPDDLHALKEGAPDPKGPIALIGAGTGLGEAFLIRDGRRTRVLPTEGGHADFAPRDEREWDLLLHMRPLVGGRVSVERVLSGPGLARIYRFLVARAGAPENPAVRAEMEREDPAAVVTRRGLDGTDRASRDALDLFISLLGAEAGNQALRILATGGVYLGGGIAPRIRERLAAGGFTRSFLDKGRFAPFLEKVPVFIILNRRTPLLGAAAVLAEGDALAER